MLALGLMKVKLHQMACNLTVIRFAVVLACALTVGGAPLGAQVPEQADVASPAEQFATIRSWEGRWQVAETSALEIVFEQTARGSAMIERWETRSGLHSITIYHLDGDALVATHYCPQGNQPRLEARSGPPGSVNFKFRDITGLDDGESHTHELAFVSADNGTVVRSEVYRSGAALEEPSSYTLSRKAVAP